MTNRIFLTDRLIKKYGDWLGQGLAEALFYVWHKGDVFEIEPDVILLDKGQSTQFISQLSVPKIFISDVWEAGADDCVPPNLDWIIASVRSQLALYRQQSLLSYYMRQAHYNGLLEHEELSGAPAHLAVFANEEDRALLEIHLHDHHHVLDPAGDLSTAEGLVVKDDLEKLTQMASRSDVQNLSLFFWSEDKEKLLTALQAGFDGILPNFAQAEPRIRKKIIQQRKLSFAKQQLDNTLEMAARDSLTGLYNYRCLSAHLPLLLDGVNKNSTRVLGMVSFDLDRFKQINDNWGHNTGDSILQKVAELLQQSLRAGDSLYRMGGDEFLALVQNVSSLEECYKLADHLCKTISQSYFVAGEEVIPVTISAGVALYGAGEGAMDFLQRADEALYNAKNTGRNRAA